MESLTGKFLVASPSLLDPNFRRGVVFLLQHSDDGAVGMVINRPLEVTVGEAVVEEVAAAADVSDPLHLGGPCSGPLTLLHDGTLTDDDGAPIGQCLASGVCLTSDRCDIEKLLEKHAPSARKFVVGYAGWGAGQLEAELAEEAWAVAEGDVAQVLAGGGDLWRRMQGLIHVSRFVPADHIPPDPRRN